MTAPHFNPDRRFAEIILGFFLITAACRAATPSNAKVDQLFAQWDRAESPGAAIVVVKDGAVAYQHGYGYANLEHRIPITPQTVFDVASVAKQFTGLSVAMLVAQGKLSLEDDIRKHLPDVPDFGKPITIGHLLHHTSGLRDWPETLALSGLDWEGPISLEMILEMVRRQRELDFTPGEGEQYSNTGYNLLAAAVAKVTGQSFRAWTDANLFRPLGMKHTLVCDNSAEVVPDSADSYGKGPGGKGAHRVVSQLSAQGSSSLFITAEDMGQWLLNFETARAGGKAAIEMIRQPGKLNDGRKVSYGFGLALGEYRGSPMINHGGGWAAYRSFVMFVPEKRFGVAVLSNAADMNTARLAYQIADLYFGDSAEKPSSPAPTKPPLAAAKSDPASWDAFLGTYRLGPGWILTITREGEQLMAQATREDKFKMTPTGTNTFFVEAYNQPVEFVRQPSGSVTNLIYRGNSAPRFTVPTSTPEYLAAYVGDYWSEELRDAARLEIHNGKLAIQQRSGAWISLVPIEADRFNSEGVGFMLEFMRNASSQVTEGRISWGRIQNIRYTRVVLPQTTAGKR